MPDPYNFRIIAILTAPATVATCLHHACAAATRLNGKVTAIHVGFDAVRAFASQEEIDIHQLLSHDGKTDEERRRAVKAAFDTWIKKTKAHAVVQWKDDEGDVGALAAQETKDADLVVMGRPVGLDDKDALHAVLFRSQRLILLAPAVEPNSSCVVGNHIIVGWKPGSSAKRAVAAASPLLQRADKVTVICVNADNRKTYAASAQAMFSQLGIRCEFISLTLSGDSVGKMLLKETAQRGGDVLLIGAFKHGDFWEAILGGVTRDVVDNAQIPILLMH